LDSREKRRLGKKKKSVALVQYVVDESNVPPRNGRPPTLDEPTRTDSEPDETGELFDLPENKIVRKWTKQKPTTQSRPQKDGISSKLLNQLVNMTGTLREERLDGAATVRQVFGLGFERNRLISTAIALQSLVTHLLARCRVEIVEGNFTEIFVPTMSADRISKAPLTISVRSFML
jgi:hypothetical protein